MKQHQLRRNEPLLQLGHTREGKPFTLAGQDFARHKHIMGISGSGKSYFLASLALLLFSQGSSFCLIDPHGDLTKLILTVLAGSDYFSDIRAYDRLWYVDFKRAEKDAAISFNVLNQPYDEHKTASILLEATHRAFPVSGTTANLDTVLQFGAHVLIENQLALTALPQFILDASYREVLLKRVTDPMVVQFFKLKFGDKVNAQLVDSTLKRFYLLTYSPILRNTLGQSANKLNFRKLMDSGVSCLFNLGGLSDDEKRLLGCLIMTNLEQALLSRADIEPEKRRPIHLLIDEFQLFMANSEVSFSRFLEECRKYSGVMYCAHQILGQLPTGIASSLQNAISIVMKAGYEDSSKLVQHFYRQPQVQPGGFFDPLLELFGFKEKHPQTIFSDIENKEQGRYLFETLNRQEALVTLNGITTLIKTNTIPHVSVSPAKLKAIEDAYAKRLLTPLSRIGQDDTPAPVGIGGLSPAPMPLAKQRVPVSSSPLTPFVTYVGASGTDDQLQAMFSLYGYLTVALVAKLLGKTENTARNKLKKLVDAGILETQSVPRTTPSGKTPLVYTLVKKGVRKHEFLEHCLATSAILVNTAVLPTVAGDFTILDLQSDYHLKVSPIQLADGNILIPDGFARLCSPKYEYAIYYEIDRNSESKEKILSKCKNYLAYASQCECLTIAFCVTEGGDLRVKSLKNWASEVLPDAYKALFLFAAIDLERLTPETLFFTPTWLSLGESTPQPLIE